MTKSASDHMAVASEAILAAMVKLIYVRTADVYVHVADLQKRVRDEPVADQIDIIAARLEKLEVRDAERNTPGCTPSHERPMAVDYANSVNMQIADAYGRAVERLRQASGAPMDRHVEKRDQAVMAERERCAKIADEHGISQSPYAYLAIAKKIRSGE